MACCCMTDNVRNGGLGLACCVERYLDRAEESDHAVLCRA